MVLGLPRFVFAGMWYETWSFVQEATLYLGFGVAGQMLRILLPQIRKLFLCPAKVLKSLFLRKNFSFGMFFAAYVGTYHASIFSNLVLR
jgi:hypothetical protein